MFSNEYTSFVNLFRSVDASEALCLPGVKAYISADDVPGENATGHGVDDEEVFATDKVRILHNDSINNSLVYAYSLPPFTLHLMFERGGDK